ncbi:GntR family transcriptional regulator/MocR family aminotransferase [Roseivirga pacifica]|uniref:GntR family transcriptional regulator / MocR family aminotransferase n=1 Tax=Roseivirga pacifica TaxID=1267423 RepID=A0A1I0P385_9BACT|nr:GntR family transcriptional regulator/MocR family aminotransferase [Roseivirga pacifica]SEW08483.1 GntR family transcriptional regulator / MocR family aminotransferase [Roseivirga pacifica]
MDYHCNPVFIYKVVRLISLQNLISLNRLSEQALYVQLSNGIVQLIKSGVLTSGMRLPSSRTLAVDFHVHRKTAIAAYDELVSQGWVDILPSKGAFVSNELPTVKTQGFDDKANGGVTEKSGFRFYKREFLHRYLPSVTSEFTLDEGIPDVRIAPVQELIRHYKRIVSRAYNAKYLSYGSVYGDELLRNTLAGYLKETRGMQVSPDQIIITRGSQMGMYLACKILFREGGLAVVGDTNYVAATLTLQNAGAKLIYVPVDDKGIDTHKLEEVCKAKPIRAVYVTSHHHHPTTVTLSADRRIHLLQLAQQYGFAIIEDDYDYDFHYRNAPMLPLASADRSGNVLYIGAICKIVAPAYRVGYLVGPKDFIEELGHVRRIIDRQGDTLLERSVAMMIEHGDYQRHSKKALKLYRERRDHFCGLLKQELGEYLKFKEPEGGMAVWAKLRQGMNWSRVAELCKQRGLIIPNYENYNYRKTADNGLRLGFASINKEEQKRVVGILKEAMDLVSE